MPSQLYKNDNISFVCARDFTYAGTDYKLGQDFPQEEALNLETLVRTRRIIPVIDNWDDKPRHWYREVQLRSVVLEKLGVDYDPSEHTVSEVVDYVERNPEQAEEILEAEEEGKDRKGVVEPVEEIAEQFRPGEHNVDEVEDYLAGDITDEEFDRVIEEERQGKARKGILSLAESKESDEDE